MTDDKILEATDFHDVAPAPRKKCVHDLCKKHLKGSSCDYATEVRLRTAVIYGGHKKKVFKSSDGYTLAVEDHPDEGHVISIRDAENPPLRIPADELEDDGIK